MLVTSGSAGGELAKSVASILGLPLLATRRRTFPDGEQYLRVEGNVRGQDVAVFQSLAYRPDQLLIEYSLLVDALKGGGAASVIGVIPYLAYARQDEVFRPNEPLSARLIPRLIESAGTDRVITVDMHLHRFKAPGDVFRVPAQNLSAMPLLARHYGEHADASRVTVVGPDSESGQWARVVAEGLGASCIVLEKERLGDRDVRIKGKLPLKGRTALIVDDMVSTGKTMVEVIKRLKGEGAQRVDALVTHALLVEGAEKKMMDAGLSKLICSDTVPGGEGRVSIAPIIAQALGNE
jgi:ribose-phosphate pyrophosphokinase